MTKKDITLLYGYETWADLRMFEVVAKLPDDQFVKDIRCSFGGIQGTFVHILSANQIWLDRWIGKNPNPLKAEHFPTLETLKKQWDIYSCESQKFIQSLTEETLQKSFQYKDFKGKIFQEPLYQQMLHKVNHSTYHRGQLVVMLKQLGADVVGTDLITYIRQQETYG